MNRPAAEDLFRQLDREIWLVTSECDAVRGGLIATSVMQASIVPEMPRVVVGIAKQHRTWEVIEARRQANPPRSSAGGVPAGDFTLQLLPAERPDLVERFGMRSGRDGDKFAGLDLQSAGTAGPLLSAAVGWLDVRIEADWESGDRSFYLGTVLAAVVPPAGTRLLTMQSLIAQLPPERRQELRTQLLADAARDRAAILTWRATTNA